MKVRPRINKLLMRLFPTWWKERSELEYWRNCQQRETILSNSHYLTAFTKPFGFGTEFFAGKKLLDIGCGPRGSLEWADMAAERHGLDPLARQYLKLGAKHHKMHYVHAPSEAIPFPDGYFDVVSTFNSLDHVEDLHRTIAEIKRVTAGGGHLLLITDVNHKPTPCEPQAFGWEITDLFSPEFETIRVGRFEKKSQGIYQSIEDAIPYDFADKSERYGIVVAQLRRIGNSM